MSGDKSPNYPLDADQGGGKEKSVGLTSCAQLFQHEKERDEITSTLLLLLVMAPGGGKKERRFLVCRRKRENHNERSYSRVFLKAILTRSQKRGTGL